MMLNIISIVNQFNHATMSSIWISIITLILIGACLLFISHISKKHKRIVWQISVLCLLIIFTISLCNATIINPNAVSTYQYVKYERKYNKNNEQHNIKTKHFSVRHITDNNKNEQYFDNAIVNAPHDNKEPNCHFWNWL